MVVQGHTSVFYTFFQTVYFYPCYSIYVVLFTHIDRNCRFRFFYVKIDCGTMDSYRIVEFSRIQLDSGLLSDLPDSTFFKVFKRFQTPLGNTPKGRPGLDQKDGLFLSVVYKNTGFLLPPDSGGSGKNKIDREYRTTGFTTGVF